MNLDQLSALLSVVIIDVVLAGDNAIVVGMAAAGIAPEKRNRVIMLGIVVAMILRILFAVMAAELLAIIGLTLAGGVLLLWVCWKMYRELVGHRREAVAAESIGCCSFPPRKSLLQAMAQIVIADVSMSLDNVLAVAGTARNHFWVLVVGLILSVALMGLASTYIARLLNRQFWIAWVGLGIITFVALRMVWEGSTEILQQTAMMARLGF